MEPNSPNSPGPPPPVATDHWPLTTAPGPLTTKLFLRGVSKRFDGRRGAVMALENVWLDVRDGEFLVLLGPSGCGKSTLLNIIAGLDTADGGEVLEDGQPVRGPGRDRSVVFQDGALFPWLTARKNVEFGLRQMGLGRRARRVRAMEFLELVGLTKFQASFPHELSGGMRQRVAIARALALEPEVLLMDEPFSALDALTREELYEQLADIWQRTGKTIIFVTHNVREAVCLGDRVILLSPAPGRIQAEFPVRIGRPRFIDDLDVTRLAQEIAAVLKGDQRAIRRQESDADDLTERDLLLRAASLLGDHY